MKPTYYGANKVMKTTILEDKTPADQEMIEMVFENGDTFKTTKLRFDLLVNARLGSTFYATMHEYDINIGEVNGITDAMVSLANGGRARAIEFLIDCEYDYMPLLKINKFLNEQRSKDGDNGTPPKGSKSDKTDQG